MKKRSRLRKCLYCGDKFTPDPYNKHHQKYCGKKECQQASHRASSKRYRQKKRDDPEYRKKEILRVKLWRLRHPGFWKRKKIKKNPEKDLLLRDFARGEKASEDEVIRDFLLFQVHCFQGFVSQLTGVVRDDIGSLINSYYDKGKTLFPELEQQFNEGVFAHGAKENHQSGTSSTVTGRVRVGRSPPGA